jgi:hypothetical protein
VSPVDIYVFRISKVYLNCFAYFHLNLRKFLEKIFFFLFLRFFYWFCRHKIGGNKYILQRALIFRIGDILIWKAAGGGISTLSVDISFHLALTWISYQVCGHSQIKYAESLNKNECSFMGVSFILWGKVFIFLIQTGSFSNK